MAACFTKRAFFFWFPVGGPAPQPFPQALDPPPSGGGVRLRGRRASREEQHTKSSTCSTQPYSMIEQAASSRQHEASRGWVQASSQMFQRNWHGGRNLFV